MTNNKAQYLFPRIGVVNLSKVTNTDLVLNQIQTYHGNYYQIFNLTNSVIFTNEKAKHRQTKFKWRGTPFSITQAIKILAKMELFLRANSGNSIIFCVNNNDSQLYAKTIVKCFIQICRHSLYSDINSKQLQTRLLANQQKISSQQPLFSQSLFEVYKKKQISSPPVKIVCSLQISSRKFIPMYQIWQQSRYNDFELVYTHQISNELVTYYFNLDKPLEKDTKSIGKKYHDNRPQTKYLQKPVIVCGDVKIVCYSFNALQKVKQFTIGFNTKQLLFSQQLNENAGIITFTYSDLFDKQQDTNQSKTTTNNKLYDQSLQVYVKLQSWCDNQQCAYASTCQQCQQHCKKLTLRYNQVQNQLQKLDRKRTPNQIQKYFSFL